MGGDDPTEVPALLAASRAPYLIGVRHHSAALAAAMPALLAAFAPTHVLIELPADLGHWLPWLGAPDLHAPVALSASTPNGGLSFYPFADFSPELAAIRWAHAAGVALEAIDRPVSALEVHAAEDSTQGGRLLGRVSNDSEELWERLIESRAPTEPEALRCAALSFGWLLRADTLHGGGIQREDSVREGYMRACIQRAQAHAGARVCVVVGAFHANALLTTPAFEAAAVPDVLVDASSSLGTDALVPYDFELLDSRSGYPAGIQDPALVQRAYELFVRGDGLEAALPSVLVEIARELRSKGHVASFSDVHEAVRMAHDLAALRGLRGPSRRELLEAIETTMVQGEPLGRGRVVARALAAVLGGQRRGHLPEGAPRSGLAVTTEAALHELGLPGPRDAKDGKELTLDPGRSALDRRRAVLLGQLDVCDVPYAEQRGGGLLGARGRVESLTLRIRAQYTPDTAARLELASRFGATAAAAAEGTLRRALARLEREDEAVASGWLQLLQRAAAAGLETVVHELLERMSDLLLPSASLPELAAAIGLLARLDQGQIATMTLERGLLHEREALLFASLRALLGMVGSTLDQDVVAFGELLELLAAGDLASLRHAIDTFVHEGSPLMCGAGAAARVRTGQEPAERFFETFASWFDLGGDDADAAARRSGLLRGALLLAGPTFEGDPGFVRAILDGLDQLDDERFLQRLPALRGGFDVLSPADRQRLLDVLGAPLTTLELDMTPELLARLAHADRAGKAALDALDLTPAPAASSSALPEPPQAFRSHAIGLHDRLRLVLGRRSARCSPLATRYARALDELYGDGHGEGSRGGEGSTYPTARDWGDELAELFDERVREEVLGHAAAAGHAGVLSQLDPEQVTPSVELLERILALHGSLSEAELEHLKRLARRVIDTLVKELATRVRPALTGLATPRTTRRRGGPLDLRKTIQNNLDTAHEHAGALRLAPRDFVFRTRAKKSIDWRIVLVVDVSGSMEASVLHAAMMAGILGGLPAVTTHFVAVSDKVVDLSEHTSDPLSLLLSVQIGGGTILSKGLRHARSLLRVPSRSIVVLVSDFDEGGSVRELLAEVRALVDGGSTVLGLAALGERHAPRYHRAIAEQLVQAGMPIAALSPLELASWVGEKLRGGT